MGRGTSCRHLLASRRSVWDYDPQRRVLAPEAEVGGRLVDVGVPHLPGQALETGAALDRLPVAVQRAGELGGVGCRPVEGLPQRGGGLRVETPEVGGLDPSVRRQLDIEAVPVDAGDGVQRGLPREVALDVGLPQQRRHGLRGDLEPRRLHLPLGQQGVPVALAVDREDVDVVVRAVDVHRRVELHAALGHAGHLGEEPRPLGPHQRLPGVQAVEAGIWGDAVRDSDDGGEHRAAVLGDGAPRLGDGDRAVRAPEPARRAGPVRGVGGQAVDAEPPTVGLADLDDDAAAGAGVCRQSRGGRPHGRPRADDGVVDDDGRASHRRARARGASPRRCGRVRRG